MTIISSANVKDIETTITSNTTTLGEGNGKTTEFKRTGYS